MTSLRTFDDLLAVGRGEAEAIAASGAAPLTYAGLRALVSQTIAALNGFGIGRNDRVAIVLPNGPEMASAFLAIGSGATAAPLNPAYRADEFEFTMSDLKAKALVVEAGGSSPALDAAKKLGIAVLTLTPEPLRAGGVFAVRRGSRGAGAARPRSGGGCGADPAHFGHDLAAEDRAAVAGQCHEIGRQCRRQPRLHGGRSRPQRHAAVPHPRADRRAPGAAVARRRACSARRASTR